MKIKIFLIVLLCSPIFTVKATAQQSIDKLIENEIGSLVSTYKTLHAMPELSGQEEKTSAFLAKELRALGYTVTEGIGKWTDRQWKGYGVVALMKNGEGPTVLVRGDMDGLPVEEKTGLPYASKVRVKTTDGREVSVMQACGHDIHVTTLIGTAKMLVQLKDQWRGTVMLIGQPAEESGAGARAMVDDGLYTKFPRPDYALALHVFNALPAGKVGYTSGNFMASSNGGSIIVRGVGGHGSSPEAKDPIVIAAQLVLALQTIVSREKSPFEPAVVSIGVIQGGTANNIIPDEVRLGLSIRTYDDKVRDQIFAAIERIAKGVGIMAGLPDDKMPIVNLRPGLPVTHNTPALTDRLAKVLKRSLGDENALQQDPIMGSEDFGYLSLNKEIPSFYFRLGGADPAQYEASQKSGKALPSNHSPLFAPLPEPTIKTGVKAMTSVVLDLMKK